MQQETTFIYSLEFPEGNIRYIGKANNPKDRLWQHISKAKLGHGSYKYSWIRSLLNKDLKPILNIVDEVPLNEWGFWEKHYITIYKSWNFKLTNLFEGGVGCNHTKESKEKIGKSNEGKVRSKEHRDAVSKANKGRVRSKESKEKFIKSNTGKRRSKDFCEANSKRLIGVKHSEERKMNQKIASANMKMAECPYCGKKGKLNIMKAFHFDKCKKSPKYKPEYFTCEYCNKTVTSKAVFTKHHGDNCSKNPNNSKPRYSCPHCGIKSTNKTNMTRYHFDNCKHKNK